MDQPQHQVFGTGKQSYRFMSYPPPKQPLQLLYPGRFMLQDYDYSGNNIPNENPIGLEETREVNAAFYKASRMENEALARHLGGKNKIARHPAVEPEAVIENPALTALSIHDTNGLNPNLDIVPSEYDHLNKIDKIDDIDVAKIRKEMHKLQTSPMTQYNQDNILPRYDWEKIPEREYFANVGNPRYIKDNCSEKGCTVYTCDDSKRECHQQFCDKNDVCLQSYVSCDYGKYCGDKNSIKNKYGSAYDTKTWILGIALIVLAILAGVFVFIIIYGLQKSKNESNASRPINYPILEPQYLPLNSKISSYP